MLRIPGDGSSHTVPGAPGALSRQRRRFDMRRSRFPAGDRSPPGKTMALNVLHGGLHPTDIPRRQTAGACGATAARSPGRLQACLSGW
jgi:hypothetical protein